MYLLSVDDTEMCWMWYPTPAFTTVLILVAEMLGSNPELYWASILAPQQYYFDLFIIIIIFICSDVARTQGLMNATQGP